MYIIYCLFMKIKTLIIIFLALFAQSLPVYSGSPEVLPASDTTQVHLSFMVSKEVYERYVSTSRLKSFIFVVNGVEFEVLISSVKPETRISITDALKISKSSHLSFLILGKHVGEKDPFTIGLQTSDGDISNNPYTLNVTNHKGITLKSISFYIMFAHNQEDPITFAGRREPDTPTSLVFSLGTY
jgi:hypothetical protein